MVIRSDSCRGLVTQKFDPTAMVVWQRYTTVCGPNPIAQINAAQINAARVDAVLILLPNSGAQTSTGPNLDAQDMGYWTSAHLLFKPSPGLVSD